MKESPIILPKRPRRLRTNASIRSLVAETKLSHEDFVLPIFVRRGGGKEEIPGMPGVFWHPLSGLAESLQLYVDAGLRAVLLFAYEEEKSSDMKAAFSENSILARAIAIVKKTKSLNGLYVISDICLCSFSDHGHCGVLQDGRIDNDETLKLLQRQALDHARAGVDMVAPSGMMDGMVAALRKALDEQQFTGTCIMSYTAKYASAFYGPFRGAAGSAMQFGDRRSYQMPITNVKEALREAELDELEGADILMVKPALAYLDIIHSLSMKSHLPIAAYQVSGEYAMIKAAAGLGMLDEEAVVQETLMAIKRSGASFIMSYFALDMLGYLKNS